MRIAHVITRLILGGAQENTLLCCEDLMRTYGDEVLLITGPALGPEGSLLQRARAGGVPMEVIGSLRRQINPLRDVLAYHRIRRALLRFRPDVVHTHSAKAGILGRMAAWRLKVPVIVHTVHGAPFHPYQSRFARGFFRACERWAAQRCHAMICVAEAMKKLLVEHAVAPPEKLVVVYSGMEVEPFLRADVHRAAVRRQLGYDDQHVVVGKIARLFHLKGHQYLIEAAGRVVRRLPNVRFLLVGDGILRDRICRQIAEAGLGQFFQLTGLVPPERIPELLSAMDMLVHVSLREGLARSLPQALMAGKPVVSYDVDGAAEVVIPGQTGYLVPPKSVDELAEAICALAADPTLRCRLGQQGRSRFAQMFDHHRMTAQIRALYEALHKDN